MTPKSSLLLRARQALPLAIVSAALVLPMPAYAFDWNIFAAVTTLFTQFMAPQPVQAPVRQQAPQNSYNFNNTLNNGYSIPTSTGMYELTGSDGKTFYVDNTHGMGTPQTVPDILNTDMQGITSPGFRNDGHGNTPVSSGSGNYPWPTTGGPISSSYGNRERVGAMCHKDDRGDGQIVQHCGIHKHNGIDIAVAAGTSVTSVTEGKVVWISSGCKGGAPGEAGCVVSIMKPNGEMSTYMHLNGTVDGLAVGDQVMQGQKFAYSGNSGTATTGAHLHFEMCQVPPEKANGSRNPLELCNMGERLNPFSKLSSTDPRYNNACRLTAKSPLNATLKGPCAYKNTTPVLAKKPVSAPVNTSTPVDTRQSTIVPGLY